jgi:uncharacterized protein (TIGR00299 family) protein
MLLGALLDLGLPQDALVRELEKLPLRGYRLESHKVHRSGLHATKLDVIVDHEQHGHHHRGLGQILAMLDDSALDPVVVERAVALFRRLAEAEATVHGTSPEQVHFHEVGAVDSIVDVVGGVIGLYWLQAARMMASPLNLGTGTVTMSHGTFPVPPPATARLVTDVPVYGAGEGELLTPTGALLITGHATSYGPLPLLRPEAVGHGAGARDTPGRPNVLRIVVGQEEAAAAAAAQPVLVIECAIDDMSRRLSRADPDEEGAAWHPADAGGSGGRPRRGRTRAVPRDHHDRPALLRVAA